MTLHRLQIFQAVAKRLSLTKAARELRISQPSISQQLKLLEEDLELKLYRKNGRGIELTPEGRLFLAEACDILERVRKLRDQCRGDLSKRDVEFLRIGGQLRRFCRCSSLGLDSV